MTQPTVTPRVWRQVTPRVEGGSIANGFVGDGAVEEEPPSESNTLIEWSSYSHNDKQQNDRKSYENDRINAPSVAGSLPMNSVMPNQTNAQ